MQEDTPVVGCHVMAPWMGYSVLGPGLVLLDPLCSLFFLSWGMDYTHGSLMPVIFVALIEETSDLEASLLFLLSSIYAHI